MARSSPTRIAARYSAHSHRDVGSRDGNRPVTTPTRRRARPWMRATMHDRRPPRESTVPPTVLIEGATKRFGDEIAVSDISLLVAPGTILGVIGPSGAGKTTTIRMLTGALAPTEGRVRVLGEDPRRFRRQTRERIGYMPQQFTLYPDLTARENVDFVASLFGMLWRTRHRRTREVLELVDLWDVRGRRAGALSGGMQRRLELACAMVHSPALLFLDEPTAGIDPLLRGRIWEELHRLRDAGRTLLVTTQYVGEAESCDTVALISGGRLIALAPPEELRRLAVGGDRVEVVTVRRRSIRGPSTASTSSARSNGWTRSACGSPSTMRPRASRMSSRRSEPTEATSRPRRRSGRHSTTSSRSSSSATARRSRRTERRRSRRPPDACLPRGHGPAARLRRQGTHRDPAPTGGDHEPGARAVPDHGRVRAGLLRRQATARDRHRRAALQRPADGHRELPGTRPWRADDRRRSSPTGPTGEARLASGAADVVVIAPEDPEARSGPGSRP